MSASAVKKSSGSASSLTSSRRALVRRIASRVATTGTPLDVLRESADEAEEDIQTIRLTAATDAGRMRQQGVNQRLAGQLTLLEGRQQQLAYNIKARDARISALTTLGRGAYQVSQIV